MHTPFLPTRAARIRAAAVISQVLMISALVACGDDQDRGTVPTLPASPAPGPVAFAKNTDKGATQRRIAFIGPFTKLHTMRPDGTDIVQLPGANAIEDDDPAWSPDYQKIAFVSNRGGGDEQPAHRERGHDGTRDAHRRHVRALAGVTAWILKDPDIRRAATDYPSFLGRMRRWRGRILAR